MNAIFARTLTTIDNGFDYVASRLHNSILPVLATSSAKPGDVVTAQLGNPFDADWTPSAQLLVLRVREDSIGCPVVDGICKRSDGATLLQLNAIQYRVGEKFRSTRALYDDEMKTYLSPEVYGDVVRLMSMYADEIEELEPFEQIRNSNTAC